MRSVIFGVLAGIFGAAVWAGISYGTGYEVGYIAWGIGGLVGFACAKGSDRGGTRVAVLAAGITILSILAGKYLAVEFLVKKELGSVEQAVQEAVAGFEEDEYLISYLADDVIEQRVEDGEEIQWPEGVDPEEGGSQESDYPPDVWASAAARWQEMSIEEQEEYRDGLSKNVREGVETYYAAMSQAGFKSSFGLMDLVFFGLAILTAYQIANKDLDGEPAVEPEGNEPSAEA